MSKKSTFETMLSRRLIWVLLLSFHGAAQDSPSEAAPHSVAHDYFVSLKAKDGLLAAHRGTMGHLPKDKVNGIELSFYKRVGGEKMWNGAYHYPYVGVTFLATTVGNNDILGYGTGCYAFFEVPFVERRRFVFTSKLSCGLGYVTKIFDQELNPKNVAVSTHFNALICLGLQGRTRITDRHELLYGIDLTHFSNGSYKVPNLGLNMAFLSLGYAYRLTNNYKNYLPWKSRYSKDSQPFRQSWKLNLLGIYSVKEVFPTEGKKYPVYALSVVGRRQFKATVGMEVALDLISKQALYGYKMYIPKTQWDIFQIGVYTGYVLPLDHMHFVLGMGAYLKDRYNPDNRFYHRIGMRYHFNNGVTANLVLKSHWAKADYVEWGLGYTFNYERWGSTSH